LLTYLEAVWSFVVFLGQLGVQVFDCRLPASLFAAQPNGRELRGDPGIIEANGALSRFLVVPIFELKMWNIFNISIAGGV